MNNNDDFNRLIEYLNNTGRSYNIDKITKAFEYAEEMHKGQFRVSGEPYISHPVAVAEIVAHLGLDTDSVCAAFLHDTVEDCPDKTSVEDIKNIFGDDIAVLVDGLTKIKDLNIIDKEEAHIENIRKMLLAMSKDIRVIFIKLCDRLHNMRTLYAKPEDKRRTTALETMHVYAPLAHRLGIQKIKQELENLALKYLDPIGYQEVFDDIEKKYGQNVNFIENTQSFVNEKFKEYNINYELSGRVKTVYSIYKKMFNQNKSFDEIYDFYALRIIVSTELECYTALGIIHELFKSVPGRFKDYISTPKPNMYQSLHTTVIGKDGIPFEVQIRTKEMHHIAEYGVAAHWKYKSGEKSKEDIDKKLAWVAKLVESEEGIIDSDEFFHALKIDIFHDETFVFTPKGDVIALPQGSTLIDFAYSIHSAIGNKMIGATINGIIAPIDSVPQTGDIVEIITSASSKGPSRDWLSIVKTGEAKNKIRQWFKKEKKAENIIVGKSEIDKELSKFRNKPTEIQKKAIIENIAKRMGMQEGEDLLNALGYGGITISKISSKLKDEYEKTVKPVEIPSELRAEDISVKSGLKSSTGVFIEGQSGYEIKFAKCCNPLPGDDIIGFITRGNGVSIHKSNCKHIINGLKREDFAERLIDATWDEYTLSYTNDLFESVIQIVAENHIALLANVTTALVDMKVSLLAINTQKKSNNEIIINLTVGCKNNEHFNSIVSKLKQIKKVISVQRVNG